MTLQAQGALAVCCSAGLCALLTAVLIRLSARLRLVAAPRADRWHLRATPNTGGIAILLSCAAVYAALGGGGRYAPIAATGAAMALLGIIDDRIQLRPAVKLLFQTAATAALLWSGVVFRPSPWEPLNFGLTFLWIVGVTNALNLIDNMDGLCAGVTVIISGFRFIVAVQAGDREGAILTAVLAGGYLGFLAFNYKPAKIFMGDGGSMFAGFTLAALAIASPMPHRRAVVSGLLYPALTFLYPIFDTVLVSVLRRLAGRPISVGGRDHSSHRLVSLGLSERRAVWLLWGLTAAGCAAGAMTAWMPIGVIAIAVLLAFGVSVLGLFLGTLPAYAMPASAPVRATRVRVWIPTLRAAVTVVVDVLLAGLALFCASLIRWEDGFSGAPLRQFLVSLPVIMFCHGAASVALRTHHCGWRWFDSGDVVTLSKAVALSCTGSVATLWIFGMRDYSRGVVLLYGFLLLGFTAALRFSMRLCWHAFTPPSAGQRVAILGANPAAELTIWILQRHNPAAILPVVVLESDPAAHNSKIHGVPVRYVASNPMTVLRAASASAVLLPPHRVLTAPEKEILAQCERAGVTIKRLELAVTPFRQQTPFGAAAAV